MSILGRYINLGTARHSEITATKHIRFTNSVALIVIFFLFQNAAIALMYDQINIYPVLFFHFLGIACIPVLNAIGYRVLAAAWFSVIALVFVTFYAHAYTLQSLNFAFLPMILFLQFFMFSKAESRYIAIFCILSLLCMAGVILWELQGLPPAMHVSEPFINGQRLNSFIGLPILSIAFGYYAFYTIHTAEHDAAVEREKTERLLLNILPKPIAERFRNDQSYFAQRYESATVLFADLVGFTSFSEKITPDELVMFLNKVFSKFDALTEEYGVEKIKTLGDAYMVAGGIPIATQDHAEKICTLALRMREAIREMQSPENTPLHIRIGICTGPVTAGVIGAKKFIYDLWGDTVNTASRMQSHAPEDGIQMTESVYALVKDHFACEDRGVIHVRGKGEMRTYLVNRLVAFGY